MTRNKECESAEASCAVPLAIGIAIGGSLSLLGTPLLLVLLLAGAIGAYACGWRVTISRNTSRECPDR
jgi:hypothetical protein